MLKPKEEIAMKKLTKRQKKLIEQLPLCETQREACIKAGYAPANVGRNGPRYVQSLLKHNDLKDILESAGITNNLLARKLKEGLESTKISRFDDNVYEDPDMIARHRYLDTVLKVKGDYAPEKHFNINAELDLMKPEDIDDVIEEYFFSDVIDAEAEIIKTES